MKDLRERAIRGGFAKICAQAAGFVIRVGSLIILARLLNPKDFGLVGMVTAFTGVLTLFRDFGLSAASVQRATVTEQQISALFWINVLVGIILTIVTVALAPLVDAFYREPKVLWITIIVSVGFLFNGAGIQHRALLQRQMRFGTLVLIEMSALIMSAFIAIGMAKAKWGYWALVTTTVSVPFISTVGSWIATSWVPGLPRRAAELRSMIRFGGTITLNGLVLYVAYNIDRVLLGRFWGPEIVGIYGRACELIKIPTDNLNLAVGEVAFATLSRIHDDPQRFKRYFLNGYCLLVTLTLPITIFCALFADDIVFVLLGPKWENAAEIFRILSPTIIVFGIANPLGWLLNALGLVDRSLKISLIFAPVMIFGYVIGLPYGARGVAVASSAVMILVVVPVSAWAVHGTVVRLADMVLAVSRPIVSGIAAAGLAFIVHVSYGEMLSPLSRVTLGGFIFGVCYLVLLLFVAGQKTLYLDIFRVLKGQAFPERAESGLR
jgi:O-antigen/teichoic acid export membrane protein